MLYFTMINQGIDLNHLFINPFAKDLGFYFVNQDIFYDRINNVLSHVNNRATKQFYDRLQHCTLPDRAYVTYENGIVRSHFELDVHQTAIEDLAYYLRPWRKGPFQLGDLFINSEWQSQMKWDRLAANINFSDKTVLDVGCGNGYYLYRLAEQNATFAFGLDPHLLYAYQFLFINAFMPHHSIGFLPMGWQSCDALKSVFDYVLCLGVLYHQRDPLALLSSLKRLIGAHGSVVIETLVLEGADDAVLEPINRYACMRNIYCIPTVSVLKQWLLSAGFSCMDVFDVSKTSLDEQRSTAWSSDHSLINFLDPNDPNKTIEGYPAPVRAILKAS